MKECIPFLFFTFLGISLIAQDITFSANPVNINENSDDAIVNATAFIINNTSETLNIKWQLNKLDFPAEWIVQVCDETQCWAEIVTSNIDPDGTGANEPVVMEPGEESIMKLQITHLDAAGCGEFTMDISTVEDPDNILATGAYFVGIDENCVVNTFNIDTKNIAVFPNPTTGQFFLEDEDQHVQTIEVYGILGNQVATFDAMSQSSFDLQNQVPGIYLVRLMSKENQALKTIRLIKK